MGPAEYLGLISIVLGIILYSIASRLPMNTLVGFRLGYSFMSRRVWVRFNRELGLALVVVGVATMALSVVGVSPYNVPVVYAFMVIAAYAVLFARARREGDIEATLRPPEPSPGYRRFERASVSLYMYPVAVALTAAPPTIALAYDSLSPSILLYMLPGALALALLVVARVDPVVLYNPWVSPGSMLRLLLEALILAGLVETIALLNALNVESRGAAILGQGMMEAITILLSAYIMLRFTAIMFRGR